MLADWEEEQQEEEEISEDKFELIKWEFDDGIKLIKYTSETPVIENVRIRTHPYKIEEEGEYDVTVVFETQGTLLTGTFGIELTLDPQKNTAIVDENNTFLYSDKPRINWYEPEVYAPSGVCRKIYFESESYDFEGLTPASEKEGEPTIYYYQLDLVLELAYK